MDKTFDPHAIETTMYQQWEAAGYFKPSGTGTPYSIMLPPPNVTGRLHMGHAFQQSLMDTLIRFRRMQGRNTLWQAGTDHAGIATQMVVERQLEAEGSSREALGREAFLERVWQWKEESGGSIEDQMRRLGTSPDWARSRFTMDDGLCQAVNKVFVDLYKEGIVYRGKRLTNWDPKLHTAIADIEVESQDKQGHLWHFRYPLAGGATTQEGHTYMVVATTRPETMLGDTAVAVHPDDERYRHLIGQSVELPLVCRTIPIIADDYVDPEFGTGCVKITPAHDFNDYEVGQRHQLPMVNVLDESANIRSTAEAFDAKGVPLSDYDTSLPESLAGLYRFDARKRIIEQFESLDLLEAIEPHGLKLPVCYRSNEVVEPMLMDQWYVKTEGLAQPAIEAVESGSMEFVPKQWENSFFAWMRNIQDWCISRQLWWGHRIPAWYDDQGNVYVGESEGSVRAQFDIAEDITLSQDEDVLDTWFSSALWTFSTLGWPEDTEALKTWAPSSVLVTGFDIIFFWVARMMMMTLHFKKELPFEKVYMHGLVRDGQGQKMSKSKGNVLDPLDIIDGIDLEALVAKRTTGLMQPHMQAKIEKATRKEFPDGIAAFGTDALRFTFCSLASTGRDIKFDFQRLEGYRNFCNKLWNAARFVLSNCEDQDNGLNGDFELSVTDQWILAKANQAQTTVIEALEEFRFDHAANALYEFVWNEYCDWYLELCKPVLYSKEANMEAQQRGTRNTLLTVLESTLRLAHPFIPFITETIWQHVAPALGIKGDSIMIADYPAPDQTQQNQEALEAVEWMKALITAVRTIRSELNIAPGKAIPVLLQHGDDHDRKRCSEYAPLLTKLAKLESIDWISDDNEAPTAALQLVNTLKVFVPLKGLIDTEAELARLNKEQLKLQKEVDRVTNKLANPKFTDKAPAEVVAKERAKADEANQALSNIQEQIERLQNL